MFNRNKEQNKAVSPDKDKKCYKAKVRISGPGVIYVRSSDLIKTKEVQRQIKTYQRLREAGRL